MSERTRTTLLEATERYRQTVVFNNTLLKKYYGERYEFNTEMQANKRRTYGVSEEGITVYVNKRAADYDKKFEAYSNKLDASVESTVKRYVDNLKASILGVRDV